jgi:hypothetical protein
MEKAALRAKGAFGEPPASYGARKRTKTPTTFFVTVYILTL